MLKHGGNLVAAAKQYGIPLQNWLDLSTGINPNAYPIPHIPTRAWQRLPEDDDGLLEAACRYYDCKHLIATAGSQAALQVLPMLRSPCRIAMPRIMYQEHAQAWQQHGHHVTVFDEMPNENAFSHVDVLLLCNPNNPTGQLFTTAQLLLWHQLLSAKGGWLIVDEAFMDATPEHSIAAHTPLEGLFILRSLGKFFGLAGVRVGFLIAPTQHLTAAQKIIGPWSVTGPSRFVAIAALLDTAWQISARKQLMVDSSQLKQLLTRHHLPAQGATALFQYSATPYAQNIKHFFATQGIWIRDFNAPHAIRLGLAPAEKLGQLSKALQLLSTTEFN